MTRVLIVDNRSQYLVGNRIALARALVDRGVEVHAATLTQRPRDHATIEGAGVAYHPVSSRLGAPGMVPALARVIRSVDPDVIHAFTLRAGMVTSLAALAQPRCPLFVSITGLGYTFIADDPRARMLRAAVRAGMLGVVRHRVTGWVFQNPDDLRVFSTRLGVEAERCSLVRGSGVDTKEVSYSPEVDTGAPPHVLFVGRLLRDKGIVEFVEAARALRDRGIAARFTAVGDLDPDNPSTMAESDLAGWRTTSPVEFVGFRDDVPALIESASVVCLPSYREGLPKVLLEAGAVGRAAVTTDVPGCREVVADGVNGLLVPVRDAAALADKIGELLADPERRREMGAAGRRIVESEFSLGHVVQRLQDVYLETAGLRL